MPTVFREVEVDVDLDDFEDDDLIDELESRGYTVAKNEDDNADSNPSLLNAIDWFKRGDVSEALIYLERAVPELYGLHKYIVKEDHRR
jgi:hypothetical protein